MGIEFGTGYILRDPSMYFQVENLQSSTNPRPKQRGVFQRKFDLRRLTEDEIAEVHKRDGVERRRQDERIKERLRREGRLHRDPLMALLGYSPVLSKN